MTWRLLQQVLSIGERILARSVGQLVDEGLDEEPVPRRFDTSPGPGRHMGLYGGPADRLVRYVIDNAGFAVGLLVARPCVVIDPGERRSVFVERRLESADDCRTIVVMLHVLLAC